MASPPDRFCARCGRVADHLPEHCPWPLADALCNPGVICCQSGLFLTGQEVAPHSERPCRFGDHWHSHCWGRRFEASTAHQYTQGFRATEVIAKQWLGVILGVKASHAAALWCRAKAPCKIVAAPTYAAAASLSVANVPR